MSNYTECNREYQARYSFINGEFGYGACGYGGPPWMDGGEYYGVYSITSVLVIWDESE